MTHLESLHSATMLQLAAVSLMLFLQDRLVRLWCRESQPVRHITPNPLHGQSRHASWLKSCACEQPAIGASFGTKAKLLLLPAAFFGGDNSSWAHKPRKTYSLSQQSLLTAGKKLSGKESVAQEISL